MRGSTLRVRPLSILSSLTKIICANFGLRICGSATTSGYPLTTIQPGALDLNRYSKYRPRPVLDNRITVNFLSEGDRSLKPIDPKSEVAINRRGYTCANFVAAPEILEPHDQQPHRSLELIYGSHLIRQERTPEGQNASF